MPEAISKPVIAPLRIGNARIARIVKLRDRAMALLREHSKCYDHGNGHKILYRDTELLKITYAGGFEETGEVAKYTCRWRAAI